jgi:sialic acid synthase SpsE
LENFKYINLNVINTFKKNFPNVVLGLSDHTPGHTTVLGAVAYGAKMIEKHFTDDQNRDGPDHQFSMNPKTWKEMVERTRELEYALGDGIKIVEQNEKETVILQRRAIRIVKDLPSGHTLSEDDLICLRPCPNDAIEPFEYEMVIGKTISREMNKGSHLKWTDLK